MGLRVGCCGFPKARIRYYEFFPIVEVQQTFYQPPLTRTAERWRAEAPQDFEFILKAWQLITHESKSPTYRRLHLPWDNKKLAHCGSFKPTAEVQWAWERTVEMARALQTRIVVFQTPASFQPSSQNKKNLEYFFKRIEQIDIIFVWEPRGLWSWEEIREICRDLNLIHGVDPFQNRPLYGHFHYYRLHGITGYRYHFTGKDLEILKEKCREGDYYLFNNSTMWEDAMAFQKLTGKGSLEAGGDL